MTNVSNIRLLSDCVKFSLLSTINVGSGQGVGKRKLKDLHQRSKRQACRSIVTSM